MDSRLPGKQLHLIWELADTDKAGRCNSHLLSAAPPSRRAGQPAPLYSQNGPRVTSAVVVLTCRTGISIWTSLWCACI